MPSPGAADPTVTPRRRPAARGRLPPRARVAAAAVSLGLLLAACGTGNDAAAPGPAERDLRAELGDATDPARVAFPQTEGRTLQELGDSIGSVGPEAALATSLFEPGRNRLAFGLVDPKSGLVYAPTAVYVANGPDSKARGPYPAPADLLVTEGPYRSAQAASEDDPFAAIYSAQVPLPRTGNSSLLFVAKLKRGFVAAASAIRVRDPKDVPVPGVGDPAPRVDTDTIVSARGDLEAIDTRRPTDSMHETNFADVVGERPVALLFATPQLCSSRVCGPVVDIAEQLKARYGDRMEFIHQEVYVDNDADQGLREPLRRFGLPTEPWLFVVGADGRVTARLEGSFGLDAFEAAVRSGL